MHVLKNCKRVIIVAHIVIISLTTFVWRVMSQLTHETCQSNQFTKLALSLHSREDVQGPRVLIIVLMVRNLYSGSVHDHVLRLVGTEEVDQVPVRVEFRLVDRLR